LFDQPYPSIGESLPETGISVSDNPSKPSPRADKGPPNGPKPAGEQPAFNDEPRRGIAASIDLAAGQFRKGRSRGGMKVLNHLRCVQCKYNLRGLDVIGVCPECGRPVADSLRGSDAQREESERVLPGMLMYVGGQRATMAFLLATPASMFLFVACLMLLGCLATMTGSVIRVLGLRAWSRAAPESALTSSIEFRRAWSMAIAELVVGGVVLLSLLFNVTAYMPDVLGSLVQLTLVLAWGVTLALGMQASTTLADAVDGHFSLNVERWRVQAILAAAAPVSIALVDLVFMSFIWIGESRVMTAVYVATSLLAIGLWASAAWATRNYFQGVSDLMHALPGAYRTALHDKAIRAENLPRTAPTTPAAREAQRQAEDDSPIPLD